MRRYLLGKAAGIAIVLFIGLELGRAAQRDRSRRESLPALLIYLFAAIAVAIVALNRQEII